MGNEEVVCQTRLCRNPRKECFSKTSLTASTTIYISGKIVLRLEPRTEHEERGPAKLLGSIQDQLLALGRKLRVLYAVALCLSTVE